MVADEGMEQEFREQFDVLMGFEAGHKIEKREFDIRTDRGRKDD